MDPSITRSIIENIISKIVLEEVDKDFLGRIYTIESYYLANGTIEDTANALIKCINWRKTDMAEYIKLSYKKTIDEIILIYIDGIPTLYYDCYRGDFNFMEAIHTSIKLIEPLLKKNKKINIIMNCTNIRTELYSDVLSLKKFISVFKQYYPYRINKGYIIGIKPFMKNIIGILRPCFSEYMRDRVIITSDIEELYSHFDKNLIQFIIDSHNIQDKTIEEMAKIFKLI